MPDVVEGGSGCRVTTQDPPPRDPDQRIPRSSEGSCLHRPRRPRATVGPPPPPVAAAAAKEAAEGHGRAGAWTPAAPAC